MSKTSKNLTAIVPFETVDSFEFERFEDPSSISRAAVVAATREMFGNDEADAEILGRLIEASLSIRDSRDRIVQELRVLGGHLSSIFVHIQGMQIRKAGENTPSVRNHAATLAWTYIKTTLEMSQPQARSIIRCYEKFADNAKAVRAFSISDLNLLVKPSITEEHVETLITKKLANPGMTRDELRAEIAALLKTQDEKVVDAEERATRLDNALDESAAELDLAERANRRLQEELTVVVKEHAEKEKALRELHSDMSLRTNHYATVQKKLADAEAANTQLTAQLVAAVNAKPLTELKEVTVEKYPESLTNLEDAITAGVAQVKALQLERANLEAEMVEMRANVQNQVSEIEAASAAKRILEEVLAAWEPFAAKYSTAQLAVQASNNAELYMPTLRALSGMMAKFMTELDAVMMRQAA